jgi:short-subunit dehydrogenase
MIVAQTLLQHGADVVLFGRDDTKLQSSVRGSRKGKSKTIKHDFLYEPETLELKVREAIVFHRGQLDGLIVCHGTLASGSLRESNLKEWD